MDRRTFAVGGLGSLAALAALLSGISNADAAPKDRDDELMAAIVANVFALALRIGG